MEDRAEASGVPILRRESLESDNTSRVEYEALHLGGNEMTDRIAQIESAEPDGYFYEWDSNCTIGYFLYPPEPEPESSTKITVLDLEDDDSLRFIQRVLESESTPEDKQAARDMVVAIRTRLRSSYSATEPNIPEGWNES
jgi:hypothetical protein